MIIVKHIDDALYFPLDLQPVSNAELTLELYSELSLTTLVFEDLSGEVSDDFIIVDLSEYCDQIPNGEYNATLYDADGVKISITLIRFDIEDGGSYDEPEYVVYHDEMDGYLTTKDMSEYEEEIAELEEEIVIKDAIISGLQEEIASVTATTINFNGVFTPAEGTLGWNSVDVQVKDYCYFKSLENNNRLGMDINDPSLHIDMEYSINEGDWVNWDFTDITLQSGDTVYFRGDNPSGTCSEQNYNYKARFATSGKFDLGGNFVSLFDKTVTATACPNYEYCFNRLFQYCNIVHINKYFLSQLTTLSPKCYWNMFESCRFMENTPELPATALTEECYVGMFRECKMLTTIPDLPATTLEMRCYQNMFAECTNLNYIKCLAIQKDRNTTIDWLKDVSPTGTFVKAFTATGWTRDINGIPEGWNVLNDDTPITGTTINSNGVFLASGTTWNSVTVNVPTGITPSGTIEITDNGVYDVTEKASANVQVPVEDYYQSGYTSGFTVGYESGFTDGVDSVPLNSTGFTENGSYTASTGGWSAVTVNVPTGITPTGQIAISGNGIYDVTQYASANVNIPLSTTGITSNGTYTKENGGWNEVTVNVPSVTTQTMTQAQYDALTIKDPMVIYLING